jgi:hypothetical protein
VKSVRLQIAQDTSEQEYAAIDKFHGEQHHTDDPVALNSSPSDTYTLCLTDVDTNDLFGTHICRSIIKDGDKLYSLSGWTRLLTDGYGLRTLLNITAALHEFIVDPPRVAYVSVVSSADHRMAASLAGLGFERWTPSGDFLNELEIADGGCSFFILPPGRLRAFRDKLQSIVTAGVLQNADGQPPMQVTVDIEIVKNGDIWHCFAEDQTDGPADTPAADA